MPSEIMARGSSPPTPGCLKPLGVGSPGVAVQAGIGTGREHGMLPEPLCLGLSCWCRGWGWAAGAASPC